MALTGSEQTSAGKVSLLATLRGRVAQFISGRHVAQRLAGRVFIIRVIGAVLAYVSQVLFARWMGRYEFGIYVYVWTWVLLIGQALDLGLATTAQRFVPEYRETRLFELLRGYLSGSRWFVVFCATIGGLVGAGLVYLLQSYLESFTIIPLYVACLILPAYALANVQDGISRSYDWVGLGIMPTYIVRQLAVTAMMGAAFVIGLSVNAMTALTLSGASIWFAALGQTFVLNRRLAGSVPRGPRRYAFRTWLGVSLPIFMVEGFYLILANTDVLVLQQYVSPSEVAIYYAAIKTLSLVSFINFAVSAAVTHRFSAFRIAGDHEGLAAFVAQSGRWVFWPSLATIALLLVFGKPLLGLFGAQFDVGYPLMFLLAIGLLARATIGPIERLLNMMGEQRICAAIYFSAFVVNIVLCIVLIPAFGTVGAAIAIASAMTLETIALVHVTRRRLGINVLIWRFGSSPLHRPSAGRTSGSGVPE